MSVFKPAALVATTGFCAGIAFVIARDVGEKQFTLIMAAASVAIAVASAVAWTQLSKLKSVDLYVDRTERTVESSVQAAEERLRQIVEVKIHELAFDGIDANPLLKKMLDSKLDDGIISALDTALRQRTNDEARTVRSLEFMHSVTLELKNRLEGPSARAERSAGWARRAAYAMALVGLGVGGVPPVSPDMSARLI